MQSAGDWIRHGVKIGAGLHGWGWGPGCCEASLRKPCCGDHIRDACPRPSRPWRQLRLSQPSEAPPQLGPVVSPIPPHLGSFLRGSRGPWPYSLGSFTLDLPAAARASKEGEACLSSLWGLNSPLLMSFFVWLSLSFWHSLVPSKGFHSVCICSGPESACASHLSRESGVLMSVSEDFQTSPRTFIRQFGDWGWGPVVNDTSILSNTFWQE